MNKLFIVYVCILVYALTFTSFVNATQQNVTLTGTTYVQLNFTHFGNECILNYSGVYYNCSDNLQIPQLPVPFTINYSYEANVTYLLSNLSGNLSLVDSSKLFNLTCPGGEDLKQWFISITPGQIVSPITNAIIADSTNRFADLKRTVDYERVIQDINLTKTQCEANLASANFVAESSRGRLKEYSIVFMILIALGGLGLLFSGFLNYRFKNRMQSDQTRKINKE